MSNNKWSFGLNPSLTGPTGSVNLALWGFFPPFQKHIWQLIRLHLLTLEERAYYDRKGQKEAPGTVPFYQNIKLVIILQSWETFRD